MQSTPCVGHAGLKVPIAERRPKVCKICVCNAVKLAESANSHQSWYIDRPNALQLLPGRSGSQRLDIVTGAQHWGKLTGAFATSLVAVYCSLV